MYIVDLKTGWPHEVSKYVKSSDGEESVWCNTWYGRHIIGKDCAFAKNGQNSLTQKNKSVIPPVSGALPIRYCQQCGEPLRRNKHKTWCEHSGNDR